MSSGLPSARSSSARLEMSRAFATISSFDARPHATRPSTTNPHANALTVGVLTEPTEWGGFTHRYFRAPTTVAEQVAGRDAIAAWARLTYGWLGRSPDYKAAFLGTLGANAEFYAPYQDNARRWYRYSQERVPFINHAIIHPPVDRNTAPGAPGGWMIAWL